MSTVPNYTEQKSHGGYLHIHVVGNAASVLEHLQKLGPEAMRNAQRRAINKTLIWVRGKAARAISAQEKIALKAVRERLIVYPIQGKGEKGKLWFGLNPLAAKRIGRVSASKSGVSVAGRRFEGAFYRQVYERNGRDILIRTHSKHYDPARYFPAKKSPRAIDPKLRNRFPLANAKVEIESARSHFERWLKEAEARLLVLMRQEVNYELQKMVNRAR